MCGSAGLALEIGLTELVVTIPRCVRVSVVAKVCDERIACWRNSMKSVVVMGFGKMAPKPGEKEDLLLNV